MSKIEEKLTVNEPSDSMLLINALDDFYHESNMLFNNIYLSQTIFNQQKNKTFPLSFDKYDASWYKNLLVSAEMLIDRFHYNIDTSKDYSYLFDSINNFDFLSFAKKWNTINYVVKFNLDENMWKVKSSEWKISQTTIWLNELLSLNIKFDKTLLDEISFDCKYYEPLADAIGRNGFDEIINYILGINDKKDDKNSRPQSPTQSSEQNLQTYRKPEREIDPRSPEGVSIEMDKLIEWILLKQATIRAKNAVERPEQKEISPVRKVMIELIEWCENKEIICRTYQNIQKYGFDPYEYVAIIEDLKKVRELRKELNSKVDACLEFATNNDPDVRFKPTKQIHRKYYKHIKLEEEKLPLPAGKELIKKLEKLNKELKETTKQTKNEILLVAEEIERLNSLLSPEERVDIDLELGKDKKELDKITNDSTNIKVESVKEVINSKENDSNDELKELLENNDINNIEKTKNKNIDELGNEKIRLIDEELKKVNKIIVSNKKVIKSKKELPISKVRDEMDQLLIWMSLKVKECGEELKKYGYQLIWENENNYSIEKIDDIKKIIQPKKVENKEQNKKQNSKKELVVKKQIKSKKDEKNKSIPVDQKHSVVNANEYADINKYNYDKRREEWHKKAGHNEKQVVCSRCKDDDNWESILLDNNKHICYYCWIKKPEQSKESKQLVAKKQTSTKNSSTNQQKKKVKK